MTNAHPGYEEKLAQRGPLWGDIYALTMSQAFYTHKKHEQITTFHAYIRKNPFDGAYLITGGQNIIAEWLTKNWKFGPREQVWMRAQMAEDPVTKDKKRIFTDEFIEFCANSKMELTVEAMPEGELAFPDEPIYRVRGPLWQCLMVETGILNAINSQSLFATLASHLVEIAGGAPVLEFGLRRAQCIGGFEPTRGAWLGGVTATSNMEAGMYYDIPNAGTFAHAFVMVHENELDAFREWAEAMPYSGVFLVDTYDTLEGVKKAVQACKEKGIKLEGIRLDSGDLAWLSREARKILDDAGFDDAKTVASNDLDCEKIAAIKAKGGRIDVWAVGTALATSAEQPALGAVYKLGMAYESGLTQEHVSDMLKLIKEGNGVPDPEKMRKVIKLSEDSIKVTIPGELDVLRYIFQDANSNKRYDGDTIISNLIKDPVQNGRLIIPVTSVRKNDDSLRKTFRTQTGVYRPLQPMLDKGALVRPIETVHEGRARAKQGLSMLDSSHRNYKHSHPYIVGVEESLANERKAMIAGLRNSPAPAAVAP